MNDFKPVLTEHIHAENSHTLEFYRSVGGYSALEKVLKSMSSDEVIEEVKISNLRGRGGAGFPAGVKWGFIPKDGDKPKYLICNADESEPGTFKDRLLMNKGPHQMLEGIIIASYAIQAHLAFIYIRGEFYEEYLVLEQMITEAKTAGLLGKNILDSGYDLEVVIHRGAGAYICGEETGLLESLEGKRGWPRIKPPFPAVEGYLKSPTIVNNVETLANVPHIFNRGIDWFRSIGPADGPGPKLYCISGRVKKPGVYEEAMGIPLKELIEVHAGGVIGGWDNLKAIIPGGASVPCLPRSICDSLVMDFDALRDVQSGLGTAAIMVMEDSPLFNAGKGSVFTSEGRNELDASLMDGRTLMAGAVGGVTTLKNPILAARAVMDHTPHVLLTNEGAEAFAKNMRLELVKPNYFHTDHRWRQLQEWKKKKAKGKHTFLDGKPKVSDSCCAIRRQPNRGLRRFISMIAAISSVDGPLGPGFMGCLGVNSSRYLRFTSKWWNAIIVDGFRIMANRMRREGRIRRAHKPAMTRSIGRRVGVLSRGRFTISS